MSRTIGILVTLLFTILAGCSGPENHTASSHVEFSTGNEEIIKVMTFNIRVDTILDVWNRWDYRKNIVFDTILENSADIIGLQEALDHQVQDIQQALPQYSHYAAGRNDGEKRGESCAIFYRKERFELIDSGTFWFSDTPSVPGSKDWGNLPPRICSWVRLSENHKGTGFYVYNVHLDHLSQNSREKSIKLLMRKVATRKTPEPFVILGDFNMKLNNPAMSYLFIGGKLNKLPKISDAWLSANRGKSEKGTGTRHSFRGGTRGPRIDHIPISSDFQAVEAKIDRTNLNGKYPSDHFPVVASIQLKKQSRNLYASKYLPDVLDLLNEKRNSVE